MTAAGEQAQEWATSGKRKRETSQDADEAGNTYAVIVNAKDLQHIDHFIVPLDNSDVKPPELVELVLQSGQKMTAGHITLDDGIDGLGKLGELWKATKMLTLKDEEDQADSLITEFSEWIDKISSKENQFNLETAPPMDRIVFSATVSIEWSMWNVEM